MYLLFFIKLMSPMCLVKKVIEQPEPPISVNHNQSQRSKRKLTKLYAYRYYYKLAPSYQMPWVYLCFHTLQYNGLRPNRIKMQFFTLKTSKAQAVPATSPYYKYTRNPFRMDSPILFPESPRKQVICRPKRFPKPFGDSSKFSSIDPVSKTMLIYMHPIYQPAMTFEIQANFDYMVQISPALPGELKSRQITLPTSSMGCLALDLDETLVHSLKPLKDYTKLGIEFSNIEKAKFESKSGKEHGLKFVTRPYAKEFLTQLSQYYQIIVQLWLVSTTQIYTSSSKEYAEEIVRALDPDGSRIASIVSRKYCIPRNKVGLKDLRLLKGKKIEKIVIVDNTIASFSGQLENGIYIPSFYGSRDDCELGKVADFLTTIASADDFRPHVSNFAGIVKLFNEYMETYP
eukprot:TRINITY_DN2031_c0_g1_i1.p1 TRINITY_DN2031_c0_g1~~TRINITY_DN2031_c0_g1_i1.p1  ORF type:complete len:401 (+),score=3.55 TRINITY_DN2031_c0_g1_i1:143-1345(+)